VGVVYQNVSACAAGEALSLFASKAPPPVDARPPAPALQLKSFICCDLSTSSEDLFIAWTVAGCLGFALSLLCSARVVKCTFGRSKRLG
jgi:hypothetical protein